MRGVKVKYLFNLFDYWGAIVTSRDSVKTLKDLEGKELAGARSTTNYQMSEFFAKKQGVDVSKVKVVNTAPPGLISYAIADRADAVQIWEPAYTLMLAKKPSIRTIDLNIEKTWKAFRRRHHSLSRCRRARRLGRRQSGQGAEALHDLQSGGGVGAEEPGRGRAAARQGRAAGGAEGGRRDDQVERAAGDEAHQGRRDIKKDIEAVYKAGMEINYLPSMPSDASIYDKPLK